MVAGHRVQAKHLRPAAGGFFYDGPLGDDMLAELRKHPAFMGAIGQC